MNAKSCFQHLMIVASMGLVSGCIFVKNAEVKEVTGAIGGPVTGSQVFGENPDLATPGRLLIRIHDDKVGRTLNEKDVQLMSALSLFALNHGADNKVKTWENTRTRHHGSFATVSTWSTSDRIQCRRFVNLIYVKKRKSRATGTACRQRDETWAIMG